MIFVQQDARLILLIFGGALLLLCLLYGGLRAARVDALAVLSRHEWRVAGKLVLLLMLK